VAPAPYRIIDHPIQPCDRGSRLPRFQWSSGCASLASTGYPAAASSNSSGCAPFPSCLGVRVAPDGALFSCAGDASSSCLASRILRRCQRLSRRLPRCPALPASPLRVFPGSPRLPHVPAVPAMEPVGCPALSILQRCRWGDSSGCPASSLLQPRLPVFPPSRPGFRTFRLCQRWSLGLPRVSHPSALPAA
jgi:hypothetical protein